MKKLILLASLSTLVFTSCIDENGLRWQEQRVLGQWEFTRVKFNERWSIVREDRLEEFENLVLNLEPDLTLVVTDQDQGTESIGTWELSTTTVSTGDGSASVNALYLAWVDPVTSEISSVVLNDLSTTRNRMWATDDRDLGLYRYRLQRVD
ncbi:MAG: hypothetical protein AAFQ98_11875 [Bacteroidota bacterium]